MLYIIDSYAWIEYFIGSKKGAVLRTLFQEKKNQFLTVECCLAEIQGWCLVNAKDFTSLFKIIRANSEITSLTEHDWIDAGKERFTQRKTQKDFGLIDATLLVKQKSLRCKIISGDKHFALLKDVVFLD